MIEVMGVAADMDDYSEAYLEQILTEVKRLRWWAPAPKPTATVISLCRFF